MLQLAVRRNFGIGNYGVGTSTALADDASSAASAPNQLHHWLAGRGALLFSHPDDFATYGFEADRWFLYLRNAFDSLQLRALAIGHDDGFSWISEIGGRFISRHGVEHLVPQLRGVGQKTSDHFVTILDGSARARRTLLYPEGGKIPSISELAQTAAQLCQRAAPSSVRRVMQRV